MQTVENITPHYRGYQRSGTALGGVTEKGVLRGMHVLERVQGVTKWWMHVAAEVPRCCFGLLQDLRN